jgi:FkbM family methyltransferase
MTSIPKRIVKRYRDKLLGNLLGSQGEIKASLHEIHETQLQINHNQLLISNETNDKLKNSGTITISPDEILTKTFSGLKMYLDPKDLTVVPHLAMDSIWEHDITIAWLKVLGPDDVVLDIGANFGYFGALAAQKTSDNARVFFFEVNPKLLPYIRKTVAANWLAGKSTVENLAVADKQDRISFSVSPYYLGSASLSHDLNASSYKQFKIASEKLDTVTVQAVAIDDYCKKHKIQKVDVIKMDIEGFEERAYQGMRRIVKSSPNVTLFIEFTKQSYKSPEVFYNQMLKDFGYVYVITKEGVIKKPRSTNYKAVVESDGEWVMPIFSKRKDLDKR